MGEGMKKNLLITLVLSLALLGCKGGGGSSSDASTDPGDITVCQDPTATNYGFIGECEYGSGGGGSSTFSGWYTRDFLLGQPDISEFKTETIQVENKLKIGVTDAGFGDYAFGVYEPSCGAYTERKFIAIQEGYNNEPLVLGVTVSHNDVSVTGLGLNITCNAGFCNSAQINSATDEIEATCDNGILDLDNSQELAANDQFGIMIYGTSLYVLFSVDVIESNFPDSYGQYTGFLIDGGSTNNTYLLSQNSTLKYDWGYGSGGSEFDTPDRYSLGYEGGYAFMGTDEFNVKSIKVFFEGVDDGSGGTTLGVFSILGNITYPGAGNYTYTGNGNHLIFYSAMD